MPWVWRVNWPLGIHSECPCSGDTGKSQSNNPEASFGKVSRHQHGRNHGRESQQPHVLARTEYGRAAGQEWRSGGHPGPGKASRTHLLGWGSGLRKGDRCLVWRCEGHPDTCRAREGWGCEPCPALTLPQGGQTWFPMSVCQAFFLCAEHFVRAPQGPWGRIQGNAWGSCPGRCPQLT